MVLLGVTYRIVMTGVFLVAGLLVMSCLLVLAGGLLVVGKVQKLQARKNPHPLE